MQGERVNEVYEGKGVYEGDGLHIQIWNRTMNFLLSGAGRGWSNECAHKPIQSYHTTMNLSCTKNIF
jgi:hypothetical protein